MRMLLTALALGWCATAAGAATVTTGTINGVTGDSVQVSLPAYTDPGQYRSYIAFSQPGTFSLAYHVQRVTNLYCDFHDGSGFVYCGGDEVPAGFDTFEGPGARTATLAYSIVALHRENYGPDQYGMVFDQLTDAGFEFTFEQDGTVSYRVVTTPVPEPAAWALMIIGFAAAGARLRAAHKPALA